MKLSIIGPRGHGFSAKISTVTLRLETPFGSLYFYLGERGLDINDCGYYIGMGKDDPALLDRPKSHAVTEWIGRKTGAIPSICRSAHNPTEHGFGW